jgi:UDP-2-acetamido-3-amino-2,3-dideoxy-glucuronate N-acetyltransferase
VLGGVCDTDEGVRASLREAFPRIPVFDEPMRMFEEPLDGVIIASPAQTHATLSIAALERGKHVFVEKPMALSLADGLRMMSAAQRAGRQLFVGHLMLYHPAVRKLRALLAENVIGRLWHVRSRRLSLGKLRQHESVWWSFAPHDVALALSIMGEEPEGVTASQTGWLSARLSDTAYADFRFSNGRSAHIEVNWLDPRKSARLDVFGTNGVITFEDFRTQYRLTVSLGGARPDEQGVLRAWRGDTYEVPVEPVEPLREEIVAFLTCIRFGIPAESDATEGLAVLRALTMAEEASAGAARADAARADAALT